MFDNFDLEMDLLEKTNFECDLNEDETIEEGVFDKFKLPADVADYKEKVKSKNKSLWKSYFKDPGFKDRFKNNNNNTINKIINESLKDSTIVSSIVITTITNDIEQISYDITCIYKNYILLVHFVDRGYFSNMSVKYNEKECDIPKDVVFDCAKTIRANKIKTKKNSITFNALDGTKSVSDSILNKYSKKYDVTRNKLTGTITISTKNE